MRRVNFKFSEVIIHSGGLELFFRVECGRAINIFRGYKGGLSEAVLRGDKIPSTADFGRIN